MLAGGRGAAELHRRGPACGAQYQRHELADVLWQSHCDILPEHICECMSMMLGGTGKTSAMQPSGVTNPLPEIKVML